ncbi:MAG TPA: hypothetical protein VEB87_01835 [Nitrososphaerales archaeon]|nr:hypothetical protein [Nitrososphaerales archaeon]
MKAAYKAPDVPDSRVTPAFVRDELLKCFESANGEFARLMHQPVTDEQLRQQVKGFMEGVFSQCGVSYVSPTKEGIITAISECKRNAEQMMGSQGAAIIEHHYSEMMKLVDRL